MTVAFQLLPFLLLLFLPRFVKENAELHLPPVGQKPIRARAAFRYSSKMNNYSGKRYRSLRSGELGYCTR